MSSAKCADISNNSWEFCRPESENQAKKKLKFWINLTTATFKETSCWPRGDDSRCSDSLHGRRRQHPKPGRRWRKINFYKTAENKEKGEGEISTESDSHSPSVCWRQRCARGRGINLNNSICEEHSSSPVSGSETRRCCVSVLLVYSPSVKEIVSPNAGIFAKCTKIFNPLRLLGCGSSSSDEQPPHLGSLSIQSTLCGNINMIITHSELTTMWVWVSEEKKKNTACK